jgi:hypothetical protein
MLEYRKYEPSDLKAVLALDFRPIEIEEGRASTGLVTSEALLLSIEISDLVYVMIHDGEICGIFGLAITPLLNKTVGAPWLLTSEIPHSCRASFWKHSKHLLREYEERCDVLMNIVSVYNVESIRYLKRLGFTFNNHFTFARAPNFPFVEFVKLCRKGEPSV